jgi:putative IMPACT (imprinted ancient) family translation regulator
MQIIVYNIGMKKINESYLEVKKSKFIGLLYSIDNEEDIKKILDELSLEHKKARHIVYAYKLGSLEKNYADKEPSGTTRGLLDIIHMKELDNVLIIVIRYFGGTLLGSGLLTRTYTKVSAELIKNVDFL